MPDAKLEIVLDAYDAARSEVLSLCDALEAVADSLPDHVDRQTCLHLARAIHPVLQRAHTVEEEQLFPIVQQSDAIMVSMADLFDGLKEDHEIDRALAEETIDFLMALGQSRWHTPPEGVGYALRGFFEGLRRHLSHESRLVDLLRARH